ncbi:MAG: GspH/FimT family pseudopilin [Parahaliea sp.]
MASSRSQQGLTFIELLIAVLVLAIVLILALPSMRRLLVGSQLRSELSRLQLAINSARTEAVSRNAIVTLCPSLYTSRGQLSCEGSFQQGWLMFEDVHGDAHFDRASDRLIASFEALPNGFRLVGRQAHAPLASPLSYYPDGSTRHNHTFMICPPVDTDLASLSLVINLVGRPRQVEGWGQC